jgi:phage gp16-like protein
MNLRPVFAKIHIAKKELGLDEDTYRDVVKRVTGQAGAATCTPLQLDRLIQEFKRLGWKPKGKRKPAKSPLVRKVWAIWGALCRSGKVHAEGRDAQRTALRAFTLRMTGVQDPEWLAPEQANKVIEGLKAWQKRGAE